MSLESGNGERVTGYPLSHLPTCLPKERFAVMFVPV